MPPVPACFKTPDSCARTHRCNWPSTFPVERPLCLTNSIVCNILCAKDNLHASSAALRLEFERAVDLVVELASEEPAVCEYVLQSMAARSPILGTTFAKRCVTSGPLATHTPQQSASDLTSRTSLGTDGTTVAREWWPSARGQGSECMLSAAGFGQERLWDKGAEPIILERLIPQPEGTVIANSQQQGAFHSDVDASVQPDTITADCTPCKEGKETLPNEVDVLLALLKHGHKEFDHQQESCTRASRNESIDEAQLFDTRITSMQEHMPKPISTHALESALLKALLPSASERSATRSSDAHVVLSAGHTPCSDPAPPVGLSEAAVDVTREKSSHGQRRWFSSTAKQTADVIIEHQRGGFSKSKITTHCLRRLPNDARRSRLMEVIARRGCGAYDFLYMPIVVGSQTQTNYGYAIINWRSEFEAEHFAKMFNNLWLSPEELGSTKPSHLEVCEATLQGFRSNVINFVNKRRLRTRDPSRLPLISVSPGTEAVPLSIETVPDELRPLVRRQDLLTRSN